jgi:signal peptidase I
MSAEASETAATAATAAGAAPEVSAPAGAANPGHQGPTIAKRVLRELRSWCWVALAFLLITGTMVQARVIPSGSMEQTLLVGDHLLMSRIGYDVSLPFTHYHLRLWREPRRQQMIIFRAPIPGPDQDFIKRLIGLPGDRLEIRQGVVYINGSALAEPYRNGPPKPSDNYGPVTVPAHSYFALGDNREDSFDSRYWGYVPESDILGTPVFIYMSVEAPDDAWQPGQTRERLLAYLNALIHPRLVRWHRLFTVF